MRQHDRGGDTNEWQRRYDASIAAAAAEDEARTGRLRGWRRLLVGTIGVVVMSLRFLVVPLYVALSIAMLAQRTVGGALVAIVLLMLLGLSVFNTQRTLARRRDRHEHWLTGLPPIHRT